MNERQLWILVQEMQGQQNRNTETIEKQGNQINYLKGRVNSLAKKLGAEDSGAKKIEEGDSKEQATE